MTPTTTEPKAVTVYLGKDGKYYLSKEKAAETLGIPKLCECGKELKGSWLKCDDCRRIEDAKRYRAKMDRMELVEWDGKTPVCFDHGDRFFFDESDAQEYMALEELDEMECIVCLPNSWRHVEADYWADEMPDDGDGELPKALDDKLTELNALLDTLRPPSYYPGNRQRVIIKAEQA